MQQYDVIVVTGEGGSAVATRCAKGGRRVAIIDDEPYGGTCALRGCETPSVCARKRLVSDVRCFLRVRGAEQDVRERRAV